MKAAILWTFVLGASLVVGYKLGETVVGVAAAGCVNGHLAACDFLEGATKYVEKIR